MVVSGGGGSARSAYVRQARDTVHRTQSTEEQDT